MGREAADKAMNNEDLTCLQIPLPEAVAKEKWSGNFDRARKRITMLLESGELSEALCCRLKLELNSMDYLEKRYTLSQDEAIAVMRERISDFSEEELEELRMQDKVDWIYINGQIRYLHNFSNTLYTVYPQIWSRTKEGDCRDYRLIKRLVRDLKDGQDMKSHIHIRHTLSIDSRAIEPGKKLSVYLPVLRDGENIENLEILDAKPGVCAISEGEQPTAFFETEVEDGAEFSVEYKFDHCLKYRDMALLNADEITEADIPPAEKKYLEEEPPHICFTPYLRTLERELAGEETNPMRLARRFYDYITTRIDYRFVRDYCAIDNLAEYCALNRRGDCGIQALLFITLCRIAGIPAKWQSGLDAKPGNVGEHDWAMFYLPSEGWFSVDLSYGGASYVRGDIDSWNFFFGNVDPYRVPINNGFQKDFEPPKKHQRIDPYDNQCGEAEYTDRGLVAGEVRRSYVDIDIH